MYLKKISLVNFKNIEDKAFNFREKINCFVGDNGIGKTNILDAIYYLSFTKSYFNPVSAQNIRHGEDFFMIEGNYILNKREEKIVCSLKKGQKKILKRNGKIYDKFSEHIGQLPLVIVSPTDRDLISEGSETRRKFIDGVLSQRDREYLRSLIAYNKVLSQRNALLKYFAANRTFDALNLKIYDEQLTSLGTSLYDKRKLFIESFTPIFNEKYKIISKGREQVSIVYKSQLHNMSFEQLLQQNLTKDKLLQYTSVGIHKDDLGFDIGQYSIKKFGSQGQQKSYLTALKLAQFEFIKKRSKVTPILLLDDIFDKLDEYRVAQIIDLVNNGKFGHIFITDTNYNRTESIVKQGNKSYEIFNL